jgi:pimeloyl-ACP methyl ester carboxylesterase
MDARRRGREARVSQQRATQQAKIGDRIITYEVVGPPDGHPVFLLHGMPGSSSGPRPRPIVLHRIGVRLISYDRPGYGGSTRQPGRSVVDAVHDVDLIAGELGIDRYAVVGRSAGGPHALAVAARRPNRVIAAAVLVSLAPSGALDLDWYGGMTRSNVDAYRGADNSRSTFAEHIRIRAERVQRDPESLVAVLRAEMSDADRRILDDPAIRRLLAEAYAEALRSGPYGWIDDALALRDHWGFELSEIRVPVRLWHGADDTFSPASHTRWLAERVPGCEVRVQSGAAHFGAVEVLPPMLGWLRSRF